MTNFKYIPYRSTKSFSKIALDYVEGAEDLSSFYSYEWDLEAIPAIIETVKKQDFNRLSLVETLLTQYEDLEMSEATKANINALRAVNTFTITTAHQLNLFTGPLYFIFKIAAAIKTCQQLNDKYQEAHFVPVYWMGSEDHDFEEINHTQVYGKTIHWTHPNPSGGVGRLSTEGMEETLAELANILGTREGATELLELLRRAYIEEKTLVAATKYLVNALFGAYGLVIVDQDEKAFKKELIPLFERELKEQISDHTIQATNVLLEAKGYHSQAFSRKINLFYLKDHQRERIEWNATTKVFEILNTTIQFTTADLLQELQAYPERFSPNVLFRPIYQQALLPNLAYIGGGGELAYWLQLKETFQELNVCLPMLMMRNSAMIVEGKQWNKMTNLGLQEIDFFEDIELLIKSFVKENGSKGLSLIKEQEAVRDIFAEVLIKAKLIDSTLEASILGEQKKLVKSLNNLEQKLIRAEKRKHEQAINQIRKLKDGLFPKGKLQERKDNFIPFYLKYGDEFIKNLIAGFEPFRKEFAIWVME